MQHPRLNISPVPDVGRAPSAPPHFPTRLSPPLPNPDFIIIALFALRLAKRLIEGLEYYPGRDADIIWLVDFLAPFSSNHSLAKISDRQKDDYLHTYPSIVSQMKKQPRYPIRFMQLNPDQSMYLSRQRGEAERLEEMTDVRRLEIIDFCDAAAEWGSRVPMPAHEADRMIELAGQRRIADLALEHSRRREAEQSQNTRQSRLQPTTFLPDRHTPHMTESARRGDESLRQGQRRAHPGDRRVRHVSFSDKRRDSEERRY